MLKRKTKAEGMLYKLQGRRERQRKREKKRGVGIERGIVSVTAGLGVIKKKGCVTFR